MEKRRLAILILSGIISFSGCKKGVNTPPEFEWYPSTIYGYTPYSVSFGDEPLKPGRTEFTEDEIIRYAGEYIDQRQELIGADSNSLRLIEVTIKRTDPQIWHLLYEQINSYKFRVVDYGTVALSITKGKVVFLESTVIPVVPIPDEAVVSDEAIRERLIGQKLTYYNKIGPKEYEIKVDTPITFKELVIFPKLREHALEIRLCRELEVRMDPGSGVGQGSRWDVFCDVITGEKIDARYVLFH